MQAYPWQALERLEREELRLGRVVRQALARAVSVDGWMRELSQLLEMEVAWVVHGVELATAPPPQPVMLCFRVDPSGLRLGLGAQGQLADLLLTRLLDRPPRFALGDAVVDATVHGALAAVVTELARRTGEDSVLTATAPWDAAEVLLVEGTLLVDGQPHVVIAWADPRGLRPTATRARSLAELGGLPITVPLIVGESACSRQLLAELELGDAWLPGQPLWINRERCGQVALAAPASERALRARSADGRLTLTELSGSLPLGLDEEHSDGASHRTSGYGGPEEPLMNDPQTHPALDAPLLIRVELGSVTLSAAEWAQLTLGDVLETEVSLSAPVVLRAAGRALARGELVEVEGHIGVRITQLETL